MRLALVVLALLTSPALAGPYCGGLSGFAPLSGQTLPPKPRLVYYVEDNYYARDKLMMHVPEFTATIDGTPAKLVVDNQRAREYVLFTIDVADARTGELVVSAENVSVHYTIDKAWAPPVLAPTVEHYAVEAAKMQRDIRHGIAIRLDAPVIAFLGRWRRDADDAWHAIKLPAIANEQAMAAMVGQRNCTPDSIPLGFLTKGIDLELSAWLPDRSKVALELPHPLVLPPAPP